MIIRTIAIALFLFSFQLSFGQCIDDDCGDVSASFELVDSTVVCEGVQFEVNNNTPSSDIDFFVWNWGDGQIDTTTTTANLFHTYNFPDSVACDFSDECETFVIMLEIFRTCPEGQSCHFISSGVNVCFDPRARFLSDQTVCIDEDINFQNNSCHGADYLWDFGNGDTSTEEVPDYSYDTEGTYTVTLTVENSCGIDQFQQNINVIGNPEADANYSLNPSTGCLPLTVTIDNASNQFANVFEWSIEPDEGWQLLDTTYSLFSEEPVFVFTDTGTYIVMMEATGQCGMDTWTDTITVFQPAGALVISPDPACDSLTWTPMVSYSGTINSYAWDFENGTPANSNDPFPSDIFFDTPGSNNVQVTVSNICGSETFQANVNIQTLDGVSIAPLDPFYCNNQDTFSIIVTSPNSNGTWSGPGISSDGIFDPTQANIGDNVLTYSYNQGLTCPGDTNITIEVIASQPVTTQTDSFYCIDHGPDTLLFSPGGGVWSGPGITDSVNGFFVPGVAQTGTWLLMYNLTDTNGCEVQRTHQVIVEELPTFSTIDTLTFCNTTEDIDLVDAFSFSVSPMGGTPNWSGDGIVDPQNGIFNSQENNANGEGTYEIAVSYHRNDCTVDTTLTVIIVPLEDADAGPDTTLCISDSTFTLEATPSPGGDWVGDFINPSTGVIDLIAAGAGTFNYEYIFGQGTSCESSDIVEVTIVDLGTNLSAGTDIAICEGNGLFQLSGFTPVTGGEWSGPGVIDPSGIVDPGQLSPDSTYVLSYCLSDPSIQCQACDQINFTLNPLPQAVFQINSTTCIGEAIDLTNTTTDGCTYTWDFGNSETSDLETPSPTYTIAGDYTITLIATSCPLCVDTFTFDISVNEPPTANFTPSSDQGCAVLEVDFNNQSTNALSYFWDFGNGDTTSMANPGTISFNEGINDTSYYVTLAVTNECGTVFHEDSINVLPSPKVAIGLNVDDGCSPLEIEFANGAQGGPSDYYWDLGNGVEWLDSLPPNQIYTTSDTSISYYTVQLIGTNPCGSDTTTREIEVFPPNVDAFLQVDTTKGCQPLTVSFSNFSTPGAMVSWDFGDGNGSSEENPVHTFNTASIFTVYQYASNCGTDIDSIIIEVLPAPEIDFYGDSVICEGAIAQFFTDSEEIVSSFWDFGDGDPSNLTNPTHVYDTAGTYTVTLTGFSLFNNCPASITREIEVLGNPVAAFTPSDNEGCAPLTIDFTNNSIGASTYAWDFGDQIQSAAQNPTHEYTEPGMYTVQLISTDANDCFSDTTYFQITVRPNPVSQFTTNAETYCARYDTVSIDNQSTGAIQCEFSFGDGNTSVECEPDYLYNTPDVFTITLVSTNEFGCTASSSQEITILGSPEAAFTPSNINGCPELEVIFQNNSQYADLFSWTFGDGNTSVNSNPSNTFTETDTFPIQLISENTNGCPADTAFGSVITWPVPVSQFSLASSTLCGIPDTITLTNLSGGATGFEWDFGNDEQSNNTNPMVAYSEAGNYDIQLIAQNSYNCRDTSVQSIAVNLQPTAGFESNELESCLPYTLNLTNTSSNFDQIYWSVGDLLESNDSIVSLEIFEPGTYDLQLIVGYQNTCFDTIVAEDAIQVDTTPIADFEWEEDLSFPYGGRVIFNNLSDFADYYEWEFGDSLTSIEINPVHEYLENGSWEVTLVAFNENGCADSVDVMVAPSVFHSLHVPNAFSPETGIGEVRLFQPKGTGILTYHLQIFSPFGELLWETREIDGHQPGPGWDGKKIGSDAYLPQGAYVWKIEVSYLNGFKEVRTGSVTIIR